MDLSEFVSKHRSFATEAFRALAFDCHQTIDRNDDHLPRFTFSADRVFSQLGKTRLHRRMLGPSRPVKFYHLDKSLTGPNPARTLDEVRALSNCASYKRPWIGQCEGTRCRNETSFLSGDTWRWKPVNGLSERGLPREPGTFGDRQNHRANGGFPNSTGESVGNSAKIASFLSRH
jgi:hypothetical protein